MVATRDVVYTWTHENDYDGKSYYYKKSNTLSRIDDEFTYTITEEGNSREIQFSNSSLSVEVERTIGRDNLPIVVEIPPNSDVTIMHNSITSKSRSIETEKNYNIELRFYNIADADQSEQKGKTFEGTFSIKNINCNYTKIVSATSNNGTPLNLRISKITGDDETTLRQSLPTTGTNALTQEEIANAKLIEVSATNKFESATITFQVGDIASNEESVAVYHKTNDSWEYLGKYVVSKEEITGVTFTSFSPIALINQGIPSLENYSGMTLANALDAMESTQNGYQTSATHGLKRFIVKFKCIMYEKTMGCREYGDDAQNYICLGDTTTSEKCNSDNLYRIIGVVSGDNSGTNLTDGMIKVIKILQ